MKLRGFWKSMRRTGARGTGCCCAAEALPAAPDPEGFSPREPVRHQEELVEYFLRGAKPATAWGVGMEYERLGLDARTGRAISYFGPRGVEAVLCALSDRFGWEKQREDGYVIGLKREGSAITLEPGGQLELSGGVHRHLFSMREEVARHFLETAAVSDPLDLRWVPIGLHPVTPIEEIDWVPKGRYAILAPFLATRGSLALYMMKGTAGVQVNLDYDSAEDASDKLRTAMSVTGVLTAACAHSPLYRGRRTGYRSRRARIWEETDSQRCGLPEFAFRDDLSVEQYVEHALHVPMVFVTRDGGWLPMHGLPFGKFLKEGYRGLRATFADWSLHLTSIFTEVRLKTYVEVRGADSVPPSLAMAVAAFWKGILYDGRARRDAWRLVSGRSFQERRAFQRDVALKGLEARLGETSARDLAGELVRISRRGLERMPWRPEGPPARTGEAAFLDPLEEIVVGRADAPAARLLADWDRDGEAPGSLLERAAADSRRFTAFPSGADLRGA